MKETVQSVLSQDYTNWHLIISDDHYPDNKIEEYIVGINDPRITYIRQEKNIGITNNFNYLLEESTADYCVFIGCDDRMLPDYLSRALATIGKADFYQPGVAVIDQDGQRYMPLVDRVKRAIRPRRRGYYSGEKLAASLCRGNWLYFPSILWKTATLKRYRFDPSYKIAEDALLQLRIIKDGGVLFYDTEVCFEYRRFANSLSSREKSKGGIRFIEEDDIYDLMSREFKVIGWRKASRAARLRLLSRLHRVLS